MKASSAVNYLYVHRDNSVVKSLLFAIKRLRLPCVYPVVHGNGVIKMFTCLYCTSIMQLKQEYSLSLNSIWVYFDYDFSWIKVIKHLCLHGRLLSRVLS